MVEKLKLWMFLYSAQLNSHESEMQTVGLENLQICQTLVATSESGRGRGRRGIHSYLTILLTLLTKLTGSLKGNRLGLELMSVFTSGLTLSCADVSLQQTVGRWQLASRLSVLSLCARLFSGCMILLQKWLCSNRLAFLPPQTWAAGRVRI